MIAYKYFSHGLFHGHEFFAFYYQKWAKNNIENVTHLGERLEMCETIRLTSGAEKFVLSGRRCDKSCRQ
jgi:hypothetical protein